MRTTVNLDEDVLLAVHERARRERRSAGEVLSELARMALTARQPATADRAATRHGFEPLPRRGGAVSNALIDRIREDDSE